MDVRLGKPRTGFVQHAVEIVPKQPVSNGLVRFKMSDRWYRGSTSAKKWHLVPFIDKIGRVHATSVGSWMCHPAQLLATTVSTVFKRLLSRCRHFSRDKRPSMHLLFRVAAYYCVTNDDSFFNRSSAMLFKASPRDLSKFVYRKEKRLSKTNRFLLDQLHFVNLWLKSRVGRCPARDLLTGLTIGTRAHRQPQGLGAVRFLFDLEVSRWASIFASPDAKPQTSHGQPVPARYWLPGDYWGWLSYPPGPNTCSLGVRERPAIFRGKP